MSPLQRLGIATLALAAAAIVAVTFLRPESRHSDGISAGATAVTPSSIPEPARASPVPTTAASIQRLEQQSPWSKASPETVVSNAPTDSIGESRDGAGDPCSGAYGAWRNADGYRLDLEPHGSARLHAPGRSVSILQWVCRKDGRLVVQFEHRAVALAVVGEDRLLGSERDRPYREWARNP